MLGVDGPAQSPVRRGSLGQYNRVDGGDEFFERKKGHKVYGDLLSTTAGEEKGSIY